MTEAVIGLSGVASIVIGIGALAGWPGALIGAGACLLVIALTAFRERTEK